MAFLNTIEISNSVHHVSVTTNIGYRINTYFRENQISEGDYLFFAAFGASKTFGYDLIEYHKEGLLQVRKMILMINTIGV